MARQRKKSPKRDQPKPAELRRGPIRRFLGACARAWQRWGPETRNWKAQAHLFALAVASAVILRLAYPRLNVAVVAAVGLAPFLWAVAHAKSGKQAFYLGWVFGAVFYYVLMFWLHVLIRYSPLMPLAVVLLGLYLGLFKGLFAWVAWRTARHGRWVFVAWPAAWAATEYLQSLGDLGFPWGYLGHALWLHPPLIQLAAWTGVYGLSLILFWINHLLSDAVRFSRKERTAPALRELAVRVVIVGVFGATIWLAHWHGNRRMARDDFYCTGPLAIGVVQPNIPQEVKLRSYSWATPDDERAQLQDDILRKTIAVTDRLRPGSGDSPCDLIIWPETAVTDEAFVFRLDQYGTFFNDLATTRYDSSLFFGATKVLILRNGRPVDRESIDPGDFKANPRDYVVEYYNSAWLAEPGRGLTPTVYDKTRMVPFGEGFPYIRRIEPLARLLTRICRTIPLVPSSEHRILTFRPHGAGDAAVPFGPLICYESCYPDLSRKRVRLGAQLLVVITNDAWYERTAGAAQHELQSIFRAVETRRWVARSANHGISCFISPRGEIVGETELAREAAVKHTLRGVKELTFYARRGEVFAGLMLILAVGFLAAGKWSRSRANGQAHAKPASD